MSQGEGVSDLRGGVQALLANVEPLDALEADHRAAALAWLESGVEIFRREKPAVPPEHLVSYCVLIDRRHRSALLVDHRDAGLWLPAGGHVDVDEDPAEAAKRELREELGVSPDFVAEIGPRPLFLTRTVTQGRSTPHTDLSLWYVFDGSVDDVLTVDDREFVAVKWWPFERIAHGLNTRFDPHLPRFIDKLKGVGGA